MWLTKATESGQGNNVPAPRLKGLWKTIVVEGRHGLGRVSCLWRFLTAVERDGGKMGRMDVYRGGETARRSERTALLGRSGYDITHPVTLIAQTLAAVPLPPH
jgi:hypothetical protein